MADERPRARPRPRPVQKTASLSSNTRCGAETFTNSSRGTSSPVGRSNATTDAQRVIVVQDTDEMFMRNRNRSSRTWQKLEQMNKEAEKQNEQNSSDSDDGNDAEHSSPRRRHKRSKKEDGDIPAWQKSKDFARLLSEEMSDNDVIEVNGEAFTPSEKQNGKRKRMRSRSRSITPPPALPMHQILHAKRIVRQTLEAAIRPPSPTIIDLDDPSDAMTLQPEFMELARRIREESKNQGKQLRHANAGAEPGEELFLTVRWQPHPLASNGKEEEWQYKIDKADSFRDLFEAVAEDAKIPSSTNIILTFQGKRFFPSVTPQTLKIWSDTAAFDAYEKTTYEYIQVHQPKHVIIEPNAPRTTTTAGTSNEPIDIDSDEDMSRGSSTSFAASTPPFHGQTQESDAESEIDLGEKMKLVLRSRLTNDDITLVVRPTTKCGAIVKAFLKKAGVEEGYPELFGNAGAVSSKGKGRKGRKSGPGVTGSGKDPRLSIDGDKLNNDISIGETDLEDGDMVEVVGL